jgi:hypothetical protein
MDEPIAQRTRCRFKHQRTSEPRKETIFLDKANTELRELLIQLVAQNKEQRKQIKAMNLVMEKVLAQQTTIVNKFLATEFLWESESKGKDSAQTESARSAPRLLAKAPDVAYVATPLRAG